MSGFAPAVFLAVVSTAKDEPPTTPAVPYPEGYRNWRHVSSAVTPPSQSAPGADPDGKNAAAPHGVIHHIYANDKALEGYRTGQFPEGSMLVADFFVLDQQGAMLAQGPRKSVNVMVRDARYTTTGGWGFEDFDRDSPTIRNVGQNAVKACFKCHRRVEDRAYVFTVLKP